MEPQEEYVKSLKQIKDAEDRAQEEVEARRKVVQEELQNLQASVETTVQAALKEAERMLEKEVEQARQKAQTEAQKILDDAKTKTTIISTKRVDAKTVHTIIEEGLLNHL